MNTLPMILDNLPQYIPTAQELVDLFKKLPPAEKIKSDTLKVPVQARRPEEIKHNYENYAFSIIRTKSETISVLTFKKYKEIKDGVASFIWIYEGIVKS